MIKPQEDLELSIKALKVYQIEPAIIKNMLSNLKKLTEIMDDKDIRIKELEEEAKELAD